MNDVMPIIPVLNPEPGLQQLCERLLSKFGQVLVVDDGSNEKVADFDRLPQGVAVIHHDINRGKGSAIKTGIQWVLDNCDAVRIIVFADGDGQHRSEDIEHVVMRAKEADCAVLGVRDFNGSGIPFRSRFGNVLTSLLVRLIFRIKIYDTQTGLRAVPRRLFKDMLEIPGERFEYEMRLFGKLRECHEKLEQVPIATVYLENNRASHFRPIQDSIRVYHGLFGGMFIKFCASSILAFLVDNLMFTVVLLGLNRFDMLRRYEILISLIIARVISAGINYSCNRKIVFASRSGVPISVFRYIVLALIIAGLSYLGTVALSAFADANGILITLIKIFVETILFILSYKCQRKWVFSSHKKYA